MSGENISVSMSTSYHNALDASRKCYWAFGSSGEYLSLSQTYECIISGSATNDIVSCKSCNQVNMRFINWIPYILV